MRRKATAGDPLDPPPLQRRPLSLLTPHIELVKRIYLPKLDQVPPRPMSFRDWWDQSVLKDGDGTFYSRRELVLALANKDGGAHVDPEMDEAYERLTRGNHVGYEVAVGGNPIKWHENPVFPSVRQMGHEILETLKAVPRGGSAREKLAYDEISGGA